jgi:hypothetical protein
MVIFELPGKLVQAALVPMIHQLVSCQHRVDTETPVHPPTTSTAPPWGMFRRALIMLQAPRHTTPALKN